MNLPPPATGSTSAAPVGDGLVLGAVAYDPKVVTIWDGFARWFAARGLPFDYVLHTNYESLAEALVDGAVDVAWNSPLAWIEVERVARGCGLPCRAVAMRDTDCDLTSVVVARADGEVRALADLRGKVIGVGAADSPQATLIPLLHVAESGLEPGRDVEVRRFDRLLGKHGDHIGGERDAARALLAGEVDAACLLDANHLAFARDGTLPGGATRVIAQTAPYDHCNFTVVGAAAAPSPVPSGAGAAAAVALFTALLLGMSYDDPEVRPLLDLEGLKAWRPGRTSGYAQLERAVDRTGYLDGWLARQRTRSAR